MRENNVRLEFAIPLLIYHLVLHEEVIGHLKRGEGGSLDLAGR